MSVSRHPIALSIENRVGSGTRLLATVMGLPLLDGVFAALVLAGAVSSLTGMIEVGIVLFGGSATVAVLLLEFDASRRTQIKTILGVGAVLVPVAAVQAALAPVIATWLSMEIFTLFAALVIIAIAAQTASARIGAYLPRPAVLIGLGLLVSVRPTSIPSMGPPDLLLVAYGAGAALIGIAFALCIAISAPVLRASVDIDRFRFGSAVALGVLPFSILDIGPVTTEAPLAILVLGMTAVLAFDPAGGTDVSGSKSAAAAPCGEQCWQAEPQSPDRAISRATHTAEDHETHPPWW